MINLWEEVLPVPEKTVLVTDYTWSSTQPEADVLAEVGAKLLLAESGREEELLRLVPQANAILTCFAHVTANSQGTYFKTIDRAQGRRLSSQEAEERPP